MTYQLHSVSGAVYSLFEIQIEKDGSAGVPMSFFVTAERADYDAKRLSKAMPGYRIALYKAARFKAFYRDGERVGKVTDYRDFYSDLSDEEYNSTKIHDSVTAEWI